MAVKIVRSPNKLALLGVPTSAAALAAGREGAPASFRKAGLVARLEGLGYTVADLGDDPKKLFAADEESPRARNLRAVLAVVDTLKPRVEQAVKSGALPVVLGGDSSIALGTIAGARRYFRHVGMIYMDSRARLHTPATTATGSIDEMVVSHLIGRGAAELVRFWGEPPLVRAPDLALFGVEQTEPVEEAVFATAPLRRYMAADIRRMGVASAAHAAMARIHAESNEFVLHVAVSAIEGFEAADEPPSGGLKLEEVREALRMFAAQQHLAAIEITGYNPSKDVDGSAAKLLVELLAEALAARMEAQQAAAEPAAELETTKPSSEEAMKPGAAPGEAWSSDQLEADERDAAPARASSDGHATEDTISETHETPADPPEDSES